MSKIKKLVSLIISISKCAIKIFTRNKVNIENNKNTKIDQNESENIDILIKGNDDCEISKNKFK